MTMSEVSEPMHGDILPEVDVPLKFNIVEVVLLALCVISATCALLLWPQSEVTVLTISANIVFFC